MRYGYFDDVNREYVITQPDTPLPWINYLGSEAYFGIISNTAGGYSFYRDARLRRLTRYRYNNVPFDYGGRYVYVRDDATGEYWSPSWQPTRKPLDEYRCRHGMGYTVIESKQNQIATRTRYFVPLGQNLEVWQFSVTNERETPADLSIFSLVEFCLWDALDDSTNYQRNFNIAQVEIEDGSDGGPGVIYHKTEYRERRDHFAYFACSAPLAGYDTHREDFLGPYRGWESPVVVERGESANSEVRSWAPIGSHHVKVQLQPGESRQIIFILGYHENPKDRKFDPPDSQIINKQSVKPVITQYLKPAVVDAAFDTLRASWDSILNIYQVETPDEATNRMVNVWNAYQCMITFNMSRSASFYESGIGRGLGFRDSNQDLLGFVHQAPERARERILDLAATQLESGGAYHQYQPLTKRGNDAVGGGFNDDPLWLPLAVIAYIKETGDWSILAEAVTYENKPGSEQPLSEHLERAMDHVLARLGPHGLPLIGRADWNDCLNLNVFSDEPGESFQIAPLKKDGSVAESVFIGGLFVLVANEMAELQAAGSQMQGAGEIPATGDLRPASWYLQKAAEMAQTVWEHGWDGAWFRRAYDAFGHVIGSSECEEGQIFIEPQGICVMAGLGLEDGRADKTLASVKERLATDHGIVLQQPAFSRYYVQLGEISSYPPGFKENASIFCHTNPWIMIAETLVGHGDQAFDYYKRICPAAREGISEVHRCEPYVYAQTIAGRDNPRHGEAKNSWLSGTAAWNYVAITQWILGIRPAYTGLRIAPVVPADWPGFTATRIFRGVTYTITVERAGKGNAVSLVVDGAPVAGDVAPLPAAGVKEVNVKVTLR
ncbi:MAG: glycosyl transferase [Anaerolineae bacterium]|nr:glycosyl transferase [Anaerolineae bacterium]